MPSVADCGGLLTERDGRIEAGAFEPTQPFESQHGPAVAAMARGCQLTGQAVMKVRR
jgi:hypothetical protein